MIKHTNRKTTKANKHNLNENNSKIILYDLSVSNCVFNY